MAFLLDTNVVSEARKRSPDPRVSSWFTSVESRDLYLSVLVIGEIRQGIERLRRRDPDQATVYEEWLATIRRDYSRRILPVTPAVAETWGRINAPDPLPVVDGLLAATALTEDLTLVTRNVTDVAATGVRTINPFVEKGDS